MDYLQHQLVAEIPALRRYAYVLTRDRESGDDLVQDTLERAWKYIDSWQKNSYFRAWLFTIMRNLYLNGRRKEKNAPSTVNMDEVQELVDHRHSHDMPVQLEELQQFIMQLPLNQREVVTLVAVEGMSYREVAQILDLPIGTVMSRLHRGREGLRSRVFAEPEITLTRRVK